MKILLAQPTVLRFKWELKVLLNNLDNLHFPLNDVVLLFASDSNDYADYFRSEFGVETHTYTDNRVDKKYIPSIRPYLWWQFLSEDSQREKNSYLYIDSDIVFRELPVTPDNLSTNKWYCADTLGYTNYTYVSTRPCGEEIVAKMNDIVGVTTNQLKEIDSGMGGAQWFIDKPKSDYWFQVYHNCIDIYNYFQSIPNKTDIGQSTGGYIQSWTAEMYAQVWTLAAFNIVPTVTDELSFSWAVDDIEKYYEHKLFHNAGVTSDMNDLFFKGNYIVHEPFDDDLSFVNKQKASYKYVQAITASKHI